MTEIWKPVKDYENYQISNLGRLKNTKLNRISAGYQFKDGYIRVKLTKNKQTKIYSLHRLVAKHFIDNPNNKPEVNHLGEKNDNRDCMLEWVTRQENCIHSAKYKTNIEIKPVYQIHIKTGEIFKKYDKMGDVKSDGFSDIRVSMCTRDVISSYRGYNWELVNKEDPITEYDDEKWCCLKDSIYDNINIFPKYYVSNYGRIKGWFGRHLKLNNCNGYQTIKLSNNKITKMHRIHRLVLMAFNTPQLNGKTEVDHIDSNIKNNHISNLRWADKKDQLDSIKNNCSISIINIKRRYKIKVLKDDEEKVYTGLYELSKNIGISTAVINKYAKNGKEYKNYKFEII